MANVQGATQAFSIPVGGSAGVGAVSVVPPTFLEKWGVTFVSVSGLWMLSVALVLLGFYIRHVSFPLPQPPSMSSDDYKKLLDLHKTASDQFRDSLSFMFDLLVFKTALPIVTLLLGYLFGSKK